MINLVKTFANNLLDVVSNTLDPYEEFTRILMVPDHNLRLHEKARNFSRDLLDGFTTPLGFVLYNRHKQHETPDYGDSALHQGLAAAAYAWKYACSKEAAHAAESSFISGALKHLLLNGKLVRGWDPTNGAKFADDASPDSAGGFLCGVYFGAKHGPPAPGVDGIRLIQTLADELIANDYCLVNQDRRPTKYGKLINGVMTDPMRSSLALAIFRAAGVMTGQPVYHQHFWKLYKKHGALLPYACPKFLDYTKTHEVHRSAIHLSILADASYGEHEVVQRCVVGLERAWKMNRKARDPWLASLVNLQWKLPASDMRDVVNRLHEYPIMGKPPCRETMNSQRDDYWKARGVHFIKVRNKAGSDEKIVRASQPLPFHLLPTQDNWSTRHPFMCDGFFNEADSFVRHTTIDFLAPYWNLRQQGVIHQTD